MVENPSDIDPVGAITLTENLVSTGLPLEGSMICPGESRPSKDRVVCSDVETLPFLSITYGSTL